MMNNLFFYRLGGAIIIFYIIFMRFLRPRAFGPIDITFTYTKYYSYIFLIGIFSITVIVLIILPFYYKYMNTVVENPEISQKTNILSLKIQVFFHERLEKLRESYNKALDAFFAKYIYGDTGNYYLVWEKMVEVVSKLHPSVTFKLIYVFYFLPPCIISLTYLIEVLVYKCFTYFPYAIFLMLFPLGIRVLLYSIQYHCRQLEEESKKYLTLLHDNPESKTYTFCDNCPLPLEHKIQPILDTLVEKKETNLQNISSFQEYRDFLYFGKYKTFFQLFSVICWIISFSTLLYLMLNN